MGRDDVVVHFTRRELKVFALWADAHRDDDVTESWLGDPKGIEAYRRAFDRLDQAAWDASTEAPLAESAPRSASDGAIEYRVRRIEGSEAEGMEDMCNELARDGWRLVTASTTAAGVDIYTYLFFSREVADDEIDRAARRFAVMATH